jgi:hypothetical protein
MNHRFGTPDGKWAKVEIMGHVEHIARCLEVPFLDGKALRVCDEVEGSPILYGAGAIFSVRWLTDEEGEKESDRRYAEHVEASKRHARGKVIGTIQQAIRDAVEGEKMTAVALRDVVVGRMPSVSHDDFAEALDNMYLDVIPPDGPGGAPLYWMDPDSNPF